MKYLRFTISDYRAINSPLTVELTKSTLVPIIGINECGKTTVLHAIVAFDYINDDQQESIGHLKDITNLFKTNPKTPTVTAEIELSREEFREALKQIQDDDSEIKDEAFKKYCRRLTFSEGPLRLTRNLETGYYRADGLPAWLGSDNINRIARQVVRRMPYILYFDDFRDKMPPELEIPADPDQASDWLDMIEQLFKKTDKDYSVFQLPKLDERRRQGVLSAVGDFLNNTLTREWERFRIDDVKALSIRFTFETNPMRLPSEGTLKLAVVEKDAKGREHFFFVGNRSKGFFWFFNFVMKLEFNAKVVSQASVDAIYVLDEPGSYLHSFAQDRLCEKLSQLSKNNIVIYCTHSHHLLNPEKIPIGTVRIAEKDKNGGITLSAISDHAGTITENRAAYQPLFEALQVRPFIVEAATTEPVVLVEGIIDFFCYKLFDSSNRFRYMPSVGAKSLKFYVSVMIAWRVPFLVLWDNDNEGRHAIAEATSHFGEIVEKGHFRLIPRGTRRNMILQNLVDGEDLRFIRNSLGLPSNTSFDKTISVLFYSQLNSGILKQLPGKTVHQVREVLESLGTGRVFGD